MKTEYSDVVEMLDFFEEGSVIMTMASGAEAMPRRTLIEVSFVKSSEKTDGGSTPSGSSDSSTTGKSSSGSSSTEKSTSSSTVSTAGETGDE